VYLVFNTNNICIATLLQEKPTQLFASQEQVSSQLSSSSDWIRLC